MTFPADDLLLLVISAIALVRQLHGDGMGKTMRADKRGRFAYAIPTGMHSYRT